MESQKQIEQCSRCTKKLGFRKHDSILEWGYQGKICHDCYKLMHEGTRKYEAESANDILNVESGRKGMLSLHNFDMKNIVFGTELDALLLVIPIKNIQDYKVVEFEEDSTKKRITTLGFSGKAKVKYLQITFTDLDSNIHEIRFKVKDLDELILNLHHVKTGPNFGSEDNEQKLGPDNFGIERYGKILLETESGMYYGGHKAYLVGGAIMEQQTGRMILTTKFFIFMKPAIRKSKRYEIIIPLKDIDIERWHIEEKARRKTFVAGTIPLFGILGTGGSIDESGKKHNLVIPYIDENGIPQEPVFGVSSITGSGIKKWAQVLYEQVVKVQKAKRLVENKIQTKIESGEDPLQILKLRLAKGEITKEEFEELKKLLD